MTLEVVMKCIKAKTYTNYHFIISKNEGDKYGKQEIFNIFY